LWLEWAWHSAETEERHSRVPRLSDTIESTSAIRYPLRNKRENAIAEGLDYQIAVTQLNRYMQAEKRD